MQRPIRLRHAAVAVVVGTIVITSSAMLFGGYWLLRQAETRLQENFFANLNRSIGERADVHFRSGRSLLEEFVHRAEIGLLPLDDHDALGAYMAERLRYLDDFAWISWGSETDGRFVGARRRDDGAIILNMSDPRVAGGKPSEWIVHADGRREPIPADFPPYDPRARPWYRTAAERTNLIWTSAIQFHEGREGVTMARALHSADGRLLGVFTTDFFTEQIADFLDTLRAGRAGFCFVLHVDGALILPTGLPPMMRKAFVGGHKELIQQWRAARAHSALRPASRVDFLGEHYLLALKESHVANGSGWQCGVMMPEREFTEPLWQATRMLLAMVASIAILSAFAGATLASRVARSLRGVTEDLHEVGLGRVQANPDMEPSGIQEVQMLRVAVEQMKEALQHRQALMNAVDEAERASQIKSDVLAMVAHDLRSPIQVVKGHSELLKANIADPEESWLAIERACEVMERLVQNMIELARLEAGRLPVARQHFTVEEVVNRAHAAIALAARVKSLAVRLDIGTPNLTMRSDPNRIEQILTNLLSNAVKYTEDGWIELECRRANSDVEFCVTDTGPGMTPEELEIAFEPFKPGRAGQGRADSHGLGLAICHKLTTRLGGTLSVESEPGRGTRFTIRLPVELPDTGTTPGLN